MRAIDSVDLAQLGDRQAVSLRDRIQGVAFAYRVKRIARRQQRAEVAAANGEENEVAFVERVRPIHLRDRVRLSADGAGDAPDGIATAELERADCDVGIVS